jgi:hypothetical protein
LASTNAASTSELHRPTLAVGAIFFLIGAALGGVGLWNLHPASRPIDPQAPRARGEILGKAIHADRTRGATVRPRHRVEYRFVTAAGAAVHGAADVERDLWMRLEVRGPIEVQYLSSDPSVQRVEGEERDPTLGIVFALVGAVFAPLGVWLVRNGLPGAPAPEGVPPRLAARLSAWFARAPALAFGIVGSVFFLPFAAGGAFWLDAVRSEQALFELRAQRTEAIVLSKSIVRKRSGTSSSSRQTESTHYQVTYRFRADGAEVVGTAEVGAGEWDRLKERSPVGVTYVGGSPWLHRVEGDGPGWVAPLLFFGIGGLGMLGGAGAAWWGWRRRGAPPRKARAEAPVPRPAPAPVRTGRTRDWRWGAGFGAVFFFAGCGALVSGLLDLATERRYAAEGREAEARVTGKRVEQAERSSRKSTQYVVLYRFDAADGRAGEGRAAVEVSAWEAAKPGDRLRVRYLPAEPGTNRPAGESEVVGAVIVSIAGLAFALIGGFFAWGCWLARNDP